MSDFNDFMWEAFGKKPKRKPPLMLTGLWKADEVMHYLELCHCEILEDDILECERRFFDTFNPNASGNNKLEIKA